MKSITATFILVILVISKISAYFIHPSVILRNSTILSLIATDDKSNFELIQRKEWKALPVTRSRFKLDIIPAPYVMIYHTGTEQCFARDTCDKMVRDLQKKYFTDTWNRDIGYNFIVSGDGKVYVGRGWDTVGAHTINMDRKSIGIALIGTFYNTLPSYDQISSLIGLIKFGINHRHISKHFEFYSFPKSLVSFENIKRIADPTCI